LAVAGISILASAPHGVLTNGVIRRQSPQESTMFRAIIAAAAVSISFAATANAQSFTVDQGEEEYINEAASPARPVQGDNRLLIVNGNTGHVVYDDGRDDLFCVTRRYVAYYTYHGRPVYRRTMRCR
jgi:hypothetical protein